MNMYDIARQITDSVIPPVTLKISKRYIHPEDGEIEIISGRYRDPTYGRISNWWEWKVIATGEHKRGYGSSTWPEVKEK